MPNETGSEDRAAKYFYIVQYIHCIMSIILCSVETWQLRLSLAGKVCWRQTALLAWEGLCVVFSGHASAAQLPKGRQAGQECWLGCPGRLHLCWELQPGHRLHRRICLEARCNRYTLKRTSNSLKSAHNLLDLAIPFLGCYPKGIIVPERGAQRCFRPYLQSIITKV